MIQSLKNPQFRTVYGNGKSKADRYLVMFVYPNGSEENRLGISVSREPEISVAPQSPQTDYQRSLSPACTSVSDRVRYRYYRPRTLQGPEEHANGAVVIGSCGKVSHSEGRKWDG